jgi:hypothetical protein
VSAPGRSPVEWADRERRKARKGLRRTVTAWVGLNPEAKRADALASRAAHGAVGEQWTAALLQQLPAGWTVFHGRKLPGFVSDYDHVLCSPCGTAVVVLDSKRWHAQRETVLVRGRVHCGREDRHEQVTAVARYARRLERALDVPGVRVLPLLVVHGSPVAGGFLTVPVAGVEGPVYVLSPPYLAPTLANAPKAWDPQRAAAVAARVDSVLRPYGEGV